MECFCSREDESFEEQSGENDLEQGLLVENGHSKSRIYDVTKVSISVRISEQQLRLG